MLIWNVDESDKPGMHWIALVKKNKHIIFFDSYGKTLAFFKRDYWSRYFRRLDCEIELYSQVQRQSHISRTCGAWCLLFLWEQWSNEQFLKNIRYKDLLKNKQQLRETIYKLFPYIHKIYEDKCRQAKGQI